jgi:hypothetical protein
MGEQTDPRMQHAIDVIVRIQRLDQLPAATVEAFMPYIRKDAALLLEAIDGPDPDWADLREMARNAGLVRSADYDPRENRYGHRDEDGYLKDDLGWVLHEWRGRDGKRLRVDLVGPIDGVRGTATLVDPSPAEVLTAARLVGLVGAVS